MIAAIIIVLASAVGSMALPLATESEVSTSGRFTIDAVRNANFQPNGPAALRKVLRKYGFPMPAGLEKRQDGSVAATPVEEDLEYTCPVNIGGQTLNLDFDTGSADLWVFGNTLSPASLGNHTAYIPSKTFKALSGYSWSTAFEDSDLAFGTVGTDTVTVGGTGVKSQAIQIATRVASSFASDTASDGSLGLAFSTINTVSPVSQKTFFDNAMSSLKKPLFTANLKHNATGSYDFGYIDSKKHTGTLKYVDVVTSNGYWEFPQTEYRVGTSGSYVSTGGATTAIADTGTTLMMVSSTIAKDYYANVTGAYLDDTQGAYLFDCNTTLPSFSVKIGSNYATIPGSLLNYAPLDSTGVQCFGGIQVYYGPQFIFGDIFFKAYFTVFDSNNGSPRFGFAPTKR